MEMLWETLGPQQEALGGGRVKEFKRNRGVRLQRQAPEIYPWVTTPVHPLPPNAGSVDDLKPTSLRVLRERTRRGASDHANVQQAPRRPRSEYCQVERSRQFSFSSLHPDWGGREIKKCFMRQQPSRSTFID